ncbi:hypothetical protein V6N11_050924 [Hibiscus sabdariffa]|uniref:CASP-like protein n=1 Tax=Hibiscus sabdariffa TaxID=183260 RepID=A0ABR2R2B1_9ROSI
MALAEQLVGVHCCCGRRFPSSDASALSLHRIVAGDSAGHLPIAEVFLQLVQPFGCVLAACSAFVSFFALSFSTDVRKGLSAPGGDRMSADRFCRCIVLSPVIALGTFLLRSTDVCKGLSAPGSVSAPVNCLLMLTDTVSLVTLVARAALVRHAMDAGQFTCHSLCACPGWRLPYVFSIDVCTGLSTLGSASAPVHCFFPLAMLGSCRTALHAASCALLDAMKLQYGAWLGAPQPKRPAAARLRGCVAVVDDADLPLHSTTPSVASPSVAFAPPISAPAAPSPVSVPTPVAPSASGCDTTNSAPLPEHVECDNKRIP